MAKGTLTKTRTVLDVLAAGTHSPQIPFSDQDDGYRSHTLYFDRQVWEDMGRPLTITVTIEPGDKLNREEL